MSRLPSGAPHESLHCSAAHTCAPPQLACACNPTTTVQCSAVQCQQWAVPQHSAVQHMHVHPHNSLASHATVHAYNCACSPTTHRQNCKPQLAFALRLVHAQPTAVNPISDLMHSASPQLMAGTCNFPSPNGTKRLASRAHRRSRNRRRHSLGTVGTGAGMRQKQPAPCKGLAKTLLSEPDGHSTAHGAPHLGPLGEAAVHAP